MGNYVYNTTYDALLHILTDYYGGTETIGMQEVNQAFAESGYSGDVWVEYINKIPGYHAVKNYDGTIRMTVQTKSVGATSYTDDVAGNINSNAQLGTNSATQQMTVNTPTHTQTNAQTGATEIARNVNGSTTTMFLTKEVLPAIAAAGVGISLGKTIDSALYNANPDFWDSHGMSGLNPDTWKGITQNMTDSAGEVALATAFNLLFGIAPDTGEVQTYIDEEAFAYIAGYLQQQHVFDSPAWDGNQPEGWNVSEPLIELPILGYTVSTTVSGATLMFTGSPYASGTPSGSRPQFSAVTMQEDGDASDSWGLNDDCKGAYIWLSHLENPKASALYCSKSHFKCRRLVLAEDFRFAGAGAAANAQSFTYDNKTVYYSLMDLTSYESPLYSGVNQNNIFSKAGQIAWLLQYGTFESQSPVGFGNQETAILPNLDGIDPTNINDVLDALREQYPNIFGDPVVMDVMQDDGTTKQYKYVPIALPSADGATDPHPTGDGQYQNQYDTAYDPDTSPWGVWDDYFKYINPFTPTDPTDPADPDGGDPSDTGDGDTPPIVIPVGSASALWKIYNPSQSQLDAFGAWLWSSDFVDQILKLFNDPMQAIIGLHKIFVTPPVSGSGSIKVGYLVSTATANYVSGQYVDVDCGSVNLKEYFGNVFDYEPYTQIRLYLPFIGIVDLSTIDCMRGKINVVYHVDVLTGACLAEVKITRDLAGGTIYTYSGNCAVQYPVSSGSYVGIITGLLGLTAGVAGSIASGGALTPALLGAGAGVGMAHTNVKHSGAISSNAGAMGIKKPYIIIERPVTQTPATLKSIEGLPENKVVNIGALSGFVRVKECHYDGIPATKQELDEIRTIMENGFFIT